MPGIDAGSVQGSPQLHVILLVSLVLPRFWRCDHIPLFWFVTVEALHHRLFVVVVVVLLLLIALFPVLDRDVGGTLIGDLGDLFDDNGIKFKLVGYLIIRRPWTF